MQIVFEFRPLVFGLRRADFPCCLVFLSLAIGGSQSDCSSLADGQALAETLTSTSSLGWLELENNNIGDSGAEAPAAERPVAGVGDRSDSLGQLDFAGDWQEGWSSSGWGMKLP